MNRIIIFFIVLLAYRLVICAQNEVRDMNAIKYNPNYIYATGTSIVSTEEASQNAKDLLNAEIEDWLIKNAESDIAGFITKSQERLGFIKTQKGNLYRVFAFVNKVDILPYYKDEIVLTSSFNNKLDGTNIESANAEIKEVTQNTIKEQISCIEKHIAVVQSVEESKYIPTDKENKILNIKTFIELNEYINEGRENEDIVQVGKYSTLPVDGIVYIFIHNREGEIPACMKNDNGRTLNLSTGEVDQITNYKGCGAIWIRFK